MSADIKNLILGNITIMYFNNGCSGRQGEALATSYSLPYLTHILIYSKLKFPYALAVVARDYTNRTLELNDNCV